MISTDIIDKLTFKIFAINKRFLKFSKLFLPFIFVCLNLIFWINKIAECEIGVREFVLAIVVGVCLLSVLFVYCPKKIRFPKVNKYIVATYIFLGFWMIIESFKNNIKFVLLPVYILSIFPVMWLVINQISAEKKRNMVMTFAKCTVLAFGFFLVLSLLFAPHTIYQFSGIFSNGNFASALVSIAFGCSLGLLVVTKKKKWIIPVALVMAFSYINTSRTAILSIVVLSLFSVIYCTVKLHSKWQRILSIMLSCVFVSALFYISFIYILNLTMKYIQPYFCLNSSWDYMEMNGIEINDVAIHTVREAWGKLIGRVDYIQRIKEASQYGGSKINMYSGGRIEIWKAYLREMSLGGHGSYPEGYSSAHNVYIQVGYDYGVICGAIYAMLAGYVFIIGEINVFKRSENYTYISYLLILAALINSLVDSCVIPYKYWPTFMFYFLLPLVLEKKSENNSIS